LQALRDQAQPVYALLCGGNQLSDQVGELEMLGSGKQILLGPRRGFICTQSRECAIGGMEAVEQLAGGVAEQQTGLLQLLVRGPALQIECRPGPSYEALQLARSAFY